MAARRTFIARAVALAAAAPLSGIAAPAIGRGFRLVPTPAQTEGPYYPDEIPADADGDLLRFAGHGPAEGTPAMVSGRVLGTDGRPIPGARVEIWQCDARGRYHHVRRESGVRSRDPGFQGFGRVLTDGEGRYAFRTIRPVPYPSRTPHIHFMVTTPDRLRLVTQLYVADEPANAADFLLQGVRDDEARASIVRPFRSSPDAGLGPSAVAARFDIVMAG